MNDSNFMDVLNSWNELVKHFDCLVLGDAFILDDVVEKFTFFHVLHDQK